MREAGGTAMSMLYHESAERMIFRHYDASANPGEEMIFESSGNLGTSALAPTEANHFTRKDYVDTALTEKVSSVQEQGTGNNITNMIYLTTTEYNAIPHLPDTLYFIVDN
jgi:hypothetical protein